MINLDLPYSVQRGETLAIPIVIYNYQDTEINTEVTLHNVEQKFEFASLTKKENDTKRNYKPLLFKGSV